MKKEEKKIWIIGKSGSDMNNVITERVSGTKFQAKRYLLSLVKEDKIVEKNEGFHSWNYGTDTINEVEESVDGILYAYGCYNDFHMDYTATPEMEVKKL